MNIRSKLPRLIGAVGGAFSICIISLMLSCTTGGSAEQGNARIFGALSGAGGADHAIDVQLVPETFNPFKDLSSAVYSTKTDSAGNYEFEKVPYGSYYLYAFDGKHAFTLLYGPYVIEGEDNSNRLNATLTKASIISIIDSNSTNDTFAHFYIKGTSLVTAIRVDSLHLVKLIGAPSGVHDVMKDDFSSQHTSFFTRNLEILPDDSITVSQNNRPPRILGASPQLPESVYVDAAYSFAIHASDPDSDSVVYSLVTALQSGAINRESGAMSWTPKQSEIQLSSILIKAADSHGAYSVFTWNLSIKSKALAPTPVPVFMKAIDTVHGYDSTYIEPKYGVLIHDTIYDNISINIEPLACDSIPVYRFYQNGEALTDWTYETTLNITPNAFGTYEFRAVAWCDTSANSPSEKSKPFIVVVNQALRPPTISGYTNRTSPDSIEVTLKITSDAPTDGSLVLYRLSVGLKELEAATPPASIGNLVADTCGGSQSCFDTIALYNFTPTQWFTGYAQRIIVVKPSATCIIQAQVKATGKAQSDWASFDVKP
jgi:hypothetical protein